MPSDLHALGKGLFKRLKVGQDGDAHNQDHEHDGQLEVSVE